jgi:hypothetical protein
VVLHCRIFLYEEVSVLDVLTYYASLIGTVLIPIFILQVFE